MSCFTKGERGFLGFVSNNLSKPKEDKTNNDAMVNIYPLACPKLIILLKKKQENEGNATKK